MNTTGYNKQGCSHNFFYKQIYSVILLKYVQIKNFNLCLYMWFVSPSLQQCFLFLNSSAAFFARHGKQTLYSAPGNVHNVAINYVLWKCQTILWVLKNRDDYGPSCQTTLDNSPLQGEHTWLVWMFCALCTCGVGCISGGVASLTASLHIQWCSGQITLCQLVRLINLQSSYPTCSHWY